MRGGGGGLLNSKANLCMCRRIAAPQHPEIGGSDSDSTERSSVVCDLVRFGRHAPIFEGSGCRHLERQAHKRWVLVVARCNAAVV